MENINAEKKMEYKISSLAGGKVIISGEHSVVYGKPAIAFNIDKYTKMDLIGYKSSISFNSFALINLLNLNKQLIISKSELIDILDNKTLLENENDKYKKHIIFLLKIIYNELLNSKINGVNSKYIKTFINNHYFIATISSEFPIGFGLGSSAAYNVCIINGIFNLIKLIIGKNFYSEDKIILLSNEGEKIFHNGTPSGIDVYCSFSGGIIFFKNINDKGIIKISHQNFFFEKIKFLLINTKIQRNSGDFIHIVSDYKKNNYKEFNDSINNIENITNKIIKLITKEKSDENDCSEFFDLIKQNQRLLKKICVSNNEIDRIINILEENGFVGKISGAGGGGFIISFVLKEKFEDLVKLLEKNDIKYMEVNISKEPAKIIDFEKIN